MMIRIVVLLAQKKITDSFCSSEKFIRLDKFVSLAVPYHTDKRMLGMQLRLPLFRLIQLARSATGQEQ
jgi:hypothetical protein